VPIGAQDLGEVSEIADPGVIDDQADVVENEFILKGIKVNQGREYG
jgi:hypothetical protein